MPAAVAIVLWATTAGDTAAAAAATNGASPSNAAPPSNAARAPGAVPGLPAAPTALLPPAPVATAANPAKCMSSGDGYFRAHVGGAVEATIDWPNSGTRCEGESKLAPPGVRLSFQRAPSSSPDLLFVFGLTGVRQGQTEHAVGVNLTVIVQGTDRIYGTLGDSRCTVDSLSQRPLPQENAYRVEARGFCTQPAHAIRGQGDVLVSTFEFAGLVTYDPPEAPAQPKPGVAKSGTSP